jgi:restriction system protein
LSAAFKPVRHRYEDALSRLSWRDFQQHIAVHFEGLGYSVDRSPSSEGASRGIDLVLVRGEETIVATCRHWTAFQVPHTDVHHLIGQLPQLGATGALLITSGEFTREAVDAAARFRHVRLVDGRALRAMLGPIDAEGEPYPSSPEAPSWTPVSSARSTAERTTDRREGSRMAAIAAVAAALVMAVAMLTLYTWYIRQIHTAQVRGVAGTAEVYRHAGVAPAPPPLATPEPATGTGGEP